MHHKIMSLMEGLLGLLLAVTAYGLIVFLLNKKGVLEKYNISFYGPALLLRTKRGISFLRVIAKRKTFWRYFGNFSIIFCVLMMILVVLLLALNTWTVMGWTPEQQKSLPGIEFGLVIPGLNPILPLEYVVYIILALIIAVIVHEFSHGILTFANHLKLKSLGILYFIIPLGAFAEPDEEQLKTTKIINRMRVYAAGPMANFTVAFLVLSLFSFGFMAAVQPVDGVHVFYVVEGSPADDLNLTTATVITGLNNSSVTSITDFLRIIHNTTVNQTISIEHYKNGKYFHSNVTLTDLSLFTKNESDRNKSFLGIGFNPYVQGFITVLQHPFTHAFPQGLLLLYSLPFFGYLVGYNPIVSPYTQAYVITGPLSQMPVEMFWGVVNALYWIFWLNLVVALFNVLPMIPLDGGFLFSDIVRSFTNRVKKEFSEEKKEKIVKNVSLIVSLIILLVVLYPWLVKYL